MTAFTDSEYTYLHELDLEAIKERVARATEGSWEVVKSDKKGVQIGTTWAHPQIKAAVAVVTTAKSLKGVTTYIKDDDAQFIAHARQDVPALIAEVERLRDKNSRLEDENTALAIEVNQLRDVVWRLGSYCDLPVDEIQRFLDGDSK